MNIKEVMHFLGIYENNAHIENEIKIQWKKAENLAVKRHRTVPFSVSSPPFVLEGKDIKKHLSDCEKGYILIATLGSGIDTYIKKLQLTDMSSAVIFDAVAGVMLEIYLDKICSEIGKSENLTTRFSPGYGDFPLSLQKDILLSAGAEKIGVSCLESNMMVPCKTVSAIIGLRRN